jgi:chitin disaccharide deacetylase
MKERRLIINADDFGLCKETNKAIKELFLSDKISSTSLLITAEEAHEATTIIQENKINFGVHLTLNSDFIDFPWRAAGGNSSLTDENGNLLFDTKLLGKQAKSADVTRECEAQIQEALERSIVPDHLDNHSGTMYGINLRAFFINAFKIASKYNLPFRFPYRNSFLKSYFGGDLPWYISVAHKIILSTAKMVKAKLIDDLVTSPHSIKDIPSFDFLENFYLEEITKIGPGVTEIVLHPSFHSEKYSKITPEWQKREYEFDILMNGKLHKRIEEEGIQVISYKDINK